MKNLFRLPTSTLAGVLIVPAAAAAAFLMNAPEALACGGSPPPPQCGVALNCTLAVGETFAADEIEAIDADVQGAMNLIITGNDPRCPNQTGALTVDLGATCTDALGADMPGGANAGGQPFTATLVNGVNNVEMPFEFNPGGARSCDVTGTASVTLSSGQSTTTQCSAQCISITDPSGQDADVPVVELRHKSTDWISKGAAGQPQQITYEVVNNSSSTFSGTFTVSAANAWQEGTTAGEVPPPSPDPASVCTNDPDPANPPNDCSGVSYDPVCGCDGQVYPNTCLMGNNGIQQYSADEGAQFCNPPAPAGVFNVSTPGELNDNFPFAIDDGSMDPCLAMPANPANTLPAEQEISVNVAANSTSEVTVIVRSWRTCPTCSANFLKMVLNGSLTADGQPRRICGGAAVTVDTTVTAPPPVECSDCPSGDCGTTDTCPTNDFCCNNPDAAQCGDDFNNSTDNNTTPGNNSTDNNTTPGNNNTPTNNDDGGCAANDQDCDGIPDGDDPDPTDDDIDDDSIPDGDEIINGTDPQDDDSDDDSVPDGDEVDQGTDPTRSDSDDDGLPDGDDPAPLDDDADDDNILDGDDTDIWNPDADNDCVLDGDDPDPATPADPLMAGCDPSVDTDGDGIFDGQEEFIYGTDPTVADTDGDGIDDGVEVNDHHTNPTLVDTDGDGLTDYDEINNHGTDPLRSDTDNDGLSDGDEINVHGTNPLDRDTDGAGATDGDEVAGGYDPTNAGDDANVLGSRLTQAGITLTSRDPMKSVALIQKYTNISDLVVRRSYASAEDLTSNIGRIRQTLEVEPSSMQAGQLFEVDVQFSTRMHEQDSPFEIGEQEMGIKPSPNDDQLDFSGIGLIRVDSQPYRLFDVAYQGSFWALNPTTGETVRLRVEQPSFAIEGNDINVTFKVQAPAFDTSLMYFMSDINGAERPAFEEACEDGSDDDGDGDVDCADSDCSQTPACQGNGDMEMACNDGVDNDDDGLVDCEDSDCAGTVSCPGDAVEICDNDGIDDDGNGAADCNDAACANHSSCQDVAAPPEGGGNDGGDTRGCGCGQTGGQAPLAPLALVGLGLVALRRRTRREDEAA